MLVDESIIPMVMFHSVGLESHPWVYSHLSEPTEVFERKIEYLARKNYKFLFWKELYDHMSGEKIQRGPCVVLTFDDGYLDNWVYVFPILEKYGVKATIFVNGEFVDVNAEIRPCHIPGRGIPIAQSAGFLSWEEMARMESSGLVDIQSHAMTHTWYFSSPKIIDFHHPGDAYPWLAWNARPERKPYYLTEDQSSFVPFGTPIYEHKKSLVCRRFYPDEEVSTRLADFASVSGDSLWEGPNYKHVLKAELERIGSTKVKGVWESDEDYVERVQWELSESRRLIQENLDKQVDFICWPGGGYNKIVLELARKVGYKSSTLSSKDQSTKRNRPYADPVFVKRIGSTADRVWRGYNFGPATPRFFYHQLRRHQGGVLSDLMLKSGYLLGAARSKIRKLI